MFKKIAFLVSIAFPLSISQSFANWELFEESNPEEGAQRIHAVWKNPEGDRKFFLRSAEPDSFVSYTETLAALPIKAGYPAVEGAEQRFMAQNTHRREAQNPHHLYTLSSQINGNDEIFPLGFIQFGRLPSRGYAEGNEAHPTAHHPIIQKCISLGITKQIDPEGAFNDANLERIENRGLAMILPLFTPDISPEDRVGAIEATYKFVCEFTKRGKTLPVEGTLPYVAVSLFHPSDPNIAAFETSGFAADADEGFGWFYPQAGVPQPRTLVTRPVEVE
ncbi:MAG: hypothetical protein K2Y08_05455 [Alphaproteobacteria bacterium]|nr:hypothetical protein [Alphaproteobacteria bacterium]